MKGKIKIKRKRKHVVVSVFWSVVIIGVIVVVCGGGCCVVVLSLVVWCVSHLVDCRLCEICCVSVVVCSVKTN